MATNYMTAALHVEPTWTDIVCNGDPEVYANINWQAHTPIASATLDAAWAAAELAQVKTQRKRDMRKERNARFFRSVPYAGDDYEIFNETVLYLVFSMAYVNAGNALPVDFKLPLVDGTGEVSDATDVETLLGNVLQVWKDHMDTYAARCATIDAASDVATVNAVVW